MLDILLDNNYDLIDDDDLVLGESSSQHQHLLLLTTKGDWKEQPVVGVGAALYLKDDDEIGLLGAIKTEFEKDGMKVNKVQYNNGKVNIDAFYNN